VQTPHRTDRLIPSPILSLLDQASGDTLRRDPLQAYSFVPSARAGFEVNRGASNGEFLCEKTDQFLVGGTVDRWSCYTNFQGIAMNTGTFGTGGFGLDMNGENGSIWAVLNDGRPHS